MERAPNRNRGRGRNLPTAVAAKRPVAAVGRPSRSVAPSRLPLLLPRSPAAAQGGQSAPVRLSSRKPLPTLQQQPANRSNLQKQQQRLLVGGGAPSVRPRSRLQRPPLPAVRSLRGRGSPPTDQQQKPQLQPLSGFKQQSLLSPQRRPLAAAPERPQQQFRPLRQSPTLRPPQPGPAAEPPRVEQPRPEPLDRDWISTEITTRPAIRISDL